MLNRTELLRRVTVDPHVLAGKPTIRGMRISVEQILAALGNGVSEADLLRDYPELESDDLRAAQTLRGRATDFRAGICRADSGVL